MNKKYYEDSYWGRFEEFLDIMDEEEQLEKDYRDKKITAEEYAASLKVLRLRLQQINF